MPIQVRLPNGEIGEFPDGTPDAEIERVLAGQFSASGQKSQSQPISWGDVPGQALSNTLPSLGRFAGDMWDSVTSPVQTAKALGNTALGYGQMAVGSQGEERKLAEGMNAYFKDRYGSEEGFKKALATDPVGVLADASTVFTGVGGALKGVATVAAKAGMAGRAAEAAGALGRAASTVGAWTDPMTLAGKAIYPAKAAARGVGNLITGGQPLAEKLYGSAIKPSTTLDPIERATIIRTGLNERLLPNQAGYDKMGGLLDKLSAEANTITRGASDVVNVEDIARQAQAQMSRGVHANTVAPSSANAIADSIVSDFLKTYGPDAPKSVAPIPYGDTVFQLELPKSTGNPNITTAEAQKIKQATGAAISDSYGDLSGPEKEARKALVKALKDKIADNAPNVKPLNDRMHNLYDLRDELTRAVARSQNANPITLSSLLGGAAAYGGAGGVGLLAGGLPGAAAGVVGMKMLTEPVNVARAAFAADALAKAQAKVGGLLDRVPLTRRGVMYPAYADRMRQDGAE